MDTETRIKAQAALSKVVLLIEQAMVAPTVPSAWKLAAGAGLEGFRDARDILELGDTYGNAFYYGVVDGPHDLYGVNLEPVALFPERNLTDIPNAIAASLDGGFLPDTDTEGVARVQVIEGWTVASFHRQAARMPRVFRPGRNCEPRR